MVHVDCRWYGMWMVGGTVGAGTVLTIVFLVWVFWLRKRRSKEPVEGTSFAGTTALCPFVTIDFHVEVSVQLRKFASQTFTLTIVCL